MSLKYECYYCHHLFPATEAIDGYHQGFKVGFLCPKCNKNIKAGLEAKQRVTPEQRNWMIIIFILMLPLIFTRKSEITIDLAGFDIRLHLILLISWVMFIVLLLILKPSLRKTTILTEPVEEI